jgi:ABC-2 type transport system ATP-binding protein
LREKLVKSREKPTLVLANLSKRFGNIEAVNDVTLAVQPGEIVGFVGPNGAGKTTTISMLMGFLRPTKGTIRILGRDVSPDTAHKTHARIGYVAGDMVLPGGLSGKQFLTFMARQNGRDKKQYDRLVSELNPVLTRPLVTLSRGNKQKVALIAALQHTPRILILDEPTSGLDPLMQDVFHHTIQTEAKRGATVLMSSHILSEVSSICTRIVFMRAGKFILDKPIEAITAQLGKHVTITSRDAPRLQKQLPKNVRLIGSSTTQLRISLEKKELQPFMRWLSTRHFDDITIAERDLDDIFREMYEVPNQGVPR